MSPPDRDLLQIIRTETERLNGTITSYLRAARPSAQRGEVCDVAGLVTEISRLIDLSPERTTDHRIRLDVPASPVLARVSRDELSQVLWNLARNGLEAMPEGGELGLIVRRTESAVELDVTDQGEGFDNERLKRLFEPLRTTKHVGTGLGLAIAHRIVRDAGGDLSINSAEGRGTVARVLLPAARSSESTPPLDSVA
jgi:signal transduction histidine kinase